MSKTQNAPPLAREELLSAMVTDADAFTALRYLRSREETPAIWELERNGAKTLPGVTAALGDVYHSLWSEGVDLKDRTKVPASRQYWRGLLEETLPTSAFHELHAKTCGDRLLSTMGTVEAAKTILKLVPKADGEKLEKIAEAQAKADQLEQEASDAQAHADGLEQMASEMMANAQGGGKPGKPAGGNPSGNSPGGNSGGMSAAEAQNLANKLSEQWADAQAKADDARAAADQATAAANAQAEALMGKPGSAEAEAKLRELARLGQAALQATTAKVTEVSETIQGWGLEKGELEKMEIPEAMGLLEKMRKNSAFKSFATLLGRMRAMAAKKARSKIEGEGRRVTRQETGRDISRAYPSELAALSHPATRLPALLRWSRGELRLRGQETKQTLGRGDIVVCEDGSGSMDGPKQQWAKGVSLSLAHFAKIQKRGFGWIMFDTRVVKDKVRPGGVLSAIDMLDIADSRSGGGTSFEAPLKRAVEMIKAKGLKKADIVFVTDGECAVSEAFLECFLAAKKALEFTVVTVLCDVGESARKTVEKFSDKVEQVSQFTVETAEAKVFNHL